MVVASLLEEIVDWVQPAFLTAGYVIIAAAVLMERSIFLGLFVPGDVILALGGVYAAQKRMDLAAVVAVGALAASLGESVGYWLGRRFGERLIKRLPLVRHLERRLDASKEYFSKHGGKTVAIGRFATAAGAFVPFSAGLGSMPYPRFLAFDVPAIVVWAAGISVLGYIFGRNLPLLDKILSRFGYLMLGLLVAFIGGRFLWRRLRRESPGQGRS